MKKDLPVHLSWILQDVNNSTKKKIHVVSYTNNATTFQKSLTSSAEYPTYP